MLQANCVVIRIVKQSEVSGDTWEITLDFDPIPGVTTTPLIFSTTDPSVAGFFLIGRQYTMSLDGPN